MAISVTYSNGTNKTFKSFDNITDNNNVIELECVDTKLTHLPENMNFPNLEYLSCDNNKLTHLPCLLYTSPSPRDGLLSRMPSSA